MMQYLVQPHQMNELKPENNTDFIFKYLINLVSASVEGELFG